MVIASGLHRWRSVPTKTVSATVVGLVLSGCVPATPDQFPARPQSSVSVATKARENIDEDAFWQIVEEARQRGQGDPDAMAEVLTQRFADAHDDTIRAFQRHLVAASRRLYTWRHGAAADLTCGPVGDDEFTDWRSWVITLGRATFERVAENPDNLADVKDLSGGCALAAELFGSAVSDIYSERHGDQDEDFPILEPGVPPRGDRLTGHREIRAALPRLVART